ncbi:MAG: hypothetical protein M3680_09850, partial [Myxococcota bacterium]|nr:hypothetical protein [Myxococcota bacterium]
RSVAGEPLATRATGERVVLPIVRGPGAIEYRIADVFDATGTHGRWELFVAPDGTPLQSASRHHRATGTLRYDVGDRYASGSRSPMNVSRAHVSVDATPTVTSATGGFAWPTAAPATVVPSVVGALVRVVNAGGALATASLIVQPGQPVVWSGATDEQVDAQLSAYVYGTIAKAAGERIHPALGWLDQQLEIHVNEDDVCNAYSTGDAIHFFRGGAECENTARLADVVHHEFGHSFHQQSIIQGAGMMDPSITEGLADFFAANITEDPAVGRGFFYDDSPVRDLDPVGSERSYPRDLSPTSHITGLIIGGALWDLRKQLVAQLGPVAGVAATERVFLGVVQRAADLTVTYVAALTADDDDGDLGNGTPNGCAIEQAFGRHGLAGETFRTTEVGAPRVDGLTVSVPVATPSGTDCPPPRVTAMTLHWQLPDGDPVELPMTAQGATWSATVPPQPAGTVVHYRITTVLDNRETIGYPDNPADPLYQLFVGPAAEIWCERLDANPMWEQTGATEWDYGIAKPVNAAAGDPPTPYAGPGMLGTDLLGDGRYRPDIMTTIMTPPIDTSAYGEVHLQFRRWLTIEDAALDVATIRVTDGGSSTQLWSNATATARTLDHIDREWRFVDLELPANPTGPVSISWTLATDPTRELGGWNLDEICLVGLAKRAICGDAIVDDGEDCDDGNLDGGDACSPSCLDASGGGCCDTGTGPSPAGPLLLGLGLLALTRRRRRDRSESGRDWPPRAPSPPRKG